MFNITIFLVLYPTFWCTFNGKFRPVNDIGNIFAIKITVWLGFYRFYGTSTNFAVRFDLRN